MHKRLNILFRDLKPGLLGWNEVPVLEKHENRSENSLTHPEPRTSAHDSAYDPFPQWVFHRFLSGKLMCGTP